MAEIVFDKTASRSVLGTMNELTFHLTLTRDALPAMTEHALSMELGRVLVTIPGPSAFGVPKRSLMLRAASHCSRQMW